MGSTEARPTESLPEVQVSTVGKAKGLTRCRISNCQKSAQKRGCCGTHYTRWWRFQRSGLWPVRATPDMSLHDRLWARIKRTTDANACWSWTGSRLADGYGHMSYKGRLYRTHRLAYECVNGPIPEALVIMHRCDNPPCCNPAHLITGTQRENARDVVLKGYHPSSLKTECVNRHPFSDENTRIARGKSGSLNRVCRECERTNARLSWRRLHGKGTWQ